MDGLPRKFFKTNSIDYYQKEFEHIGQQPILNRELYLGDETGPSSDQWQTFGYTDRYREYREEPSTVHGDFRDLLDHWHMGRKFDETPVLNGDFVDCNPTTRIFAEREHHPLWVTVAHSIQARRRVGKSAQGRAF